MSLLRCHACRKCLLSAPADSEAGPRQGRLLGATPADRRQAGAAPACGWALVQHPEQQCWLGCLSVVPRRSLRQRDVSLCCRGTQARPFASHAPAPPRSGRRHRPRPPLYHCLCILAPDSSAFPLPPHLNCFAVHAPVQAANLTLVHSARLAAACRLLSLIFCHLPASGARLLHSRHCYSLLPARPSPLLRACALF